MTQYGTFRKVFLLGFALSLLAATLVVVSPGLQALHLSSCHHHGANHGFAALLHDHDTHAHHSTKNFKSSKDSFFIAHKHSSEHCPICQALASLAQHFTVHEKIAIARPTLATVAGPPDPCRPLLSPPINYSISPRAPPSLLA